MYRGKVVWFDPHRGYGFIEPDDGSDDVFVHITSVEKSGIDTLQQNDRVEFEMEKSERSGKYQAANLRLV